MLPITCFKLNMHARIYSVVLFDSVVQMGLYRFKIV